MKKCLLLIGLVSVAAESFIYPKHLNIKLYSPNLSGRFSPRVDEFVKTSKSTFLCNGGVSDFQENKESSKFSSAKINKIDNKDLSPSSSTLVNKIAQNLPLPTILISLLVIHKCVTDVLSHHTRTTGVQYSATMVAVLGEAIKVPILLIAITCFEGMNKVAPIITEAVKVHPFQLMLPGLAYSAQNILYFMALSRISAASYQILSQSKLLFTGFFMSGLLKRKLGVKQYLSLVLLMGGTVLTQLSEMSSSSMGGGTTSSALIGGALTVLGAALSALPNVYYEKVLKSDSANQWVKNVQLTFWIWFWLLIFASPEMYQSVSAFKTSTLLGRHTMFGNILSSLSMCGMNKAVLSVMVLQGLKCLIVPATLKHADNIAYAYAKPASILLTAFVSSFVSQEIPSTQFVCGASAVIMSMWLYSQN